MTEKYVMYIVPFLTTKQLSLFGIYYVYEMCVIGKWSFPVDN